MLVVTLPSTVIHLKQNYISHLPPALRDGWQGRQPKRWALIVPLSFVTNITGETHTHPVPDPSHPTLNHPLSFWMRKCLQMGTKQEGKERKSKSNIFWAVNILHVQNRCQILACGPNLPHQCDTAHVALQYCKSQNALPVFWRVNQDRTFTKGYYYDDLIGLLLFTVEI